MKTFLVPFYLKKIKKIEKELKDSRINVSINPLPDIRIKFSKGNLFLYKVKLEGKTLYGRDFLSKIHAGDLENMPSRRFFSYIISGIIELIKNIDPDVIYNLKDIDKPMKEKLFRNIAKSIIYSAETFVMVTKNKYFLNKRHMLDYIDDNKLKYDLEIALKIIENDRNGNNIDISEFWFRAREDFIFTFKTLIKKYYNIKNLDINKYLEINDNMIIKNLEYPLLVLITKKEILIKPIFSRKSVEKKMFECLLLLLLSIEKKYINKWHLNTCMKILNSFTINKGTTEIDDSDVMRKWKYLRDLTIKHVPYTCSLMGV